MKEGLIRQYEPGKIIENTFYVGIIYILGYASIQKYI